MLFQELHGEMRFREAFAVWMSHRRMEPNGLRAQASYLAKKTERDYRVCAKALEKFFGGMRLAEIHPGHLASYQRARAACDRSCGAWAHAAGANCIRKELGLLIRILKAARLWGDEQALRFTRLRPEEPEARRALSPEEQHRLLHVASSRAEWRLIYQYAIVALQTTASTNEMRALRLGDVFPRERFLQIPRAGAKNRYRQRTIPLVTDDAVWAVEGLIERARSLGAASPAHYLFPVAARRGEYDPTRPMSESGLKKPWNAVRRAAGLPLCRLYDLRHTGITRMAEAGVPLAVAMQFAGHMTEAMQRRYTAISMAASRGWGEQVWGAAPGSAAKKPPARADVPVEARMRRA